MLKVTAFIARSFAPMDERRLRRTLEFLGTFEKTGFFCQSAEPAEVESVSDKVRRSIDQADVFIAFFTKRHPIYDGNVNLHWFRRLFSRLRPKAWSAPPWVLQESGYALAKNKKLILLREANVEIPGLDGDLEYLHFVPENEAQVFSKLSETINTLVAEASGRRIEVTAREDVIERPFADEPSPMVKEPKSGAATDQTPSVPSLTPHFVGMIKSSEQKDAEGVEEAYEKGRELITSGVVTNVDLVVWDATALQYKFTAGSAKALDELRTLMLQNPTRPEPPMRIAHLLFDSQEYDEAAELFLKAGNLATSKSGFRISAFVRAARTHLLLQQKAKALQIAWEAYRESDGEQKREICSLLYEILKQQKESLLAFGIAEAALRDNPQHPIRFQLGLDYHNAQIEDLFLLHFDYIHRSDSTNLAALHNVALALSSCGLPIASVESYRRAVEAGETLAAVNLGYKYLDAGMAEDAKQLLQNIMKLDVYDSRIDGCFSDIGSRSKEEEEKKADILRAAQERRKFLVQIGEGLQQEAAAIDGPWKLPFGTVSLISNNGQVSGSTEIQTPQAGNGNLLGRTTPDPIKTEIYRFDGELAGAVCKFKLTIENKDLRNTAFAYPETKEGFIVFRSEEQDGTYTEIKGGEIGDRLAITKLGP